MECFLLKNLNFKVKEVKVETPKAVEEVKPVAEEKPKENVVEKPEEKRETIENKNLILENDSFTGFENSLRIKINVKEREFNVYEP